MIATPPGGKKKKRRLERLVRGQAGNGVFDQAKAAAGATVVSKLVCHHPIIAAELALAGVARGVGVGLEEAKRRVWPDGTDPQAKEGDDEGK